MRVTYHVFERSDFERDQDRPRCAVCGNLERAATGTGHVDTEGEANRLNAEQASKAAVAEHKAKIAWNVSKAMEALATFAEASSELDNLLYGIPYTDELHPMHSDVTEAAYRSLGDANAQLRELGVALSDLKREVS